MASGDILGTGISALLAYQRALSTTGHNIANVNTDGFTRQRVELGARPPQIANNGAIGQGVDVNTVQRLYSDFLTSQVRTASTSFNRLDSMYALASQVDNVLADPQAGLAPTLQDFFNAVQDVANDPSSGAARQVLLSNGESLANRFHFLNGQIDGLRDSINSDIRSLVTEINGLAQGIADVNHEIVLAQGLAGGQPANDLLDKRDALVAQLAERVGVSTRTESDGSLSVFIGSGQTLVLGSEARSLDVTSNPYDPTRAEVAFAPADSSSVISDFLSGGRLGGVLEFRSQTLDATQNALGRLAIGLASTFNAQHALGQDLYGNLGGDFFSVPVPASYPAANNSTDTNISVDIVDAGALTTADYRLQFDGVNGWSLRNLSTGSAVTLSGAGTDANPFVADGLSISVEGLAAAPGQSYSFLIQPTRSGAADIATAIHDPSLIAAAAPLRADAYTGNLGNAELSLGAVSNVDSLPLASSGGPITLTFDGSTAAGTPASAASNDITFAGTKGTQGIDFSGLTLADIDNGDNLVIGGNRFVVDNTGTQTDDYSTRTFYVDTSAVASLDDLAQAFADKIDAVDASASNTFSADSLDPTVRVGSAITLTSAYATSTTTHLEISANAFDTGGIGATAATSLTAGSGPAAGDTLTFNGEDFVFNFLGSGVVSGAAQTEVAVGATADDTAANFAAAVDPQPGVSAAAVANVVTLSADTVGAARTALVTDTNPTADSGISQSVTAGADATGQLPGFVISGGPGGTIAYDPATDSGGKTFTLGPPFDGISFTISGVPSDGDSFVIADNASGVGDNRNALLLAGLQTDRTLGNGTLSYEKAYTQIVADVGSSTRQTEVNREAQSSLLRLTTDARDSVSGVNLDEEAANLLRFEQAYQAAAQVISTANTMFDELLNAVRR
jgi:flagellar hook-associated protein 1 FlgK